jgi:hypothetical protein
MPSGLVASLVSRLKSAVDSAATNIDDIGARLFDPDVLLKSNNDVVEQSSASGADGSLSLDSFRADYGRVGRGAVIERPAISSSALFRTDVQTV